MKHILCSLIGIIGNFVTILFGGWDTAIGTLILFMAIDFFLRPCRSRYISQQPKKQKPAPWNPKPAGKVYAENA